MNNAEINTIYAKARRIDGNKKMRSRIIMKNLKGIIGGTILIIIVLLAILGPSLYKVDPNSTNITNRLKPPALFGGCMEHPFGTDELGRDILSRIMQGARVSLMVSVSAVLISILFGVPLGMIAGYYGGVIDNVLMRIGDIQLSIPFLVLAIAIVAVLGPSLVNVVIILGVTGWVQFARLVRANTMKIKGQEFILAAKAMGSSSFRIFYSHILRNILSTIIVLATFQLALLIIVESSLSFLGLGVPLPTASWGSMINDGRNYLQMAWWLSTIPGCMITLIVLGANLFGDWLRDSFDPHLKHQG